jgi:hypothetical protein
MLFTNEIQAAVIVNTNCSLQGTYWSVQLFYQSEFSFFLFWTVQIVSCIRVELSVPKCDRLDDSRSQS